MSSASSAVHCRIVVDMNVVPLPMMWLSKCLGGHALCCQLTILSPTTQITRSTMRRIRAGEMGSSPVSIEYRTVKEAPMPAQTA